MDAFTVQPITATINGHQATIQSRDYRCALEGEDAGGWINLAVSVDGSETVSICGGWLVAPGQASCYSPTDPCQDWQVVPYDGYDNCGGGIGPDEEHLIDTLGYEGTDHDALLAMVSDINAAARPIFSTFRQWARNNT